MHNVDPATGAFVCETVENGTVYSMDCESTRYDGCMVAVNCWAARDDEGGGGRRGCGQATQLAMAEFLRCFEGPFANTEAPVNASMRVPCFERAGLLFGPVQECYDDAHRVTRIEQRLNASKTAMMASLGPSPGYFPHIFVDGQHQYNDSWCALTRTICDTLLIGGSAAAAATPRPCASASLVLSFDLTPALAAEVATAPLAALEAALQLAVDIAVSAAALPTHFDTDDDALPPGDPSYVNVRATNRVVVVASSVASASVEAAADAGQGEATRETSSAEAAADAALSSAARPPPLGLRRVVCDVELLAAFRRDGLDGLPTPRFRSALVYAFAVNGVTSSDDVCAADIRNVRVRAAVR